MRSARLLLEETPGSRACIVSSPRVRSRCSRPAPRDRRPATSRRQVLPPHARPRHVPALALHQRRSVLLEDLRQHVVQPREHGWPVLDHARLPGGPALQVRHLHGGSDLPRRWRCLRVGLAVLRIPLRRELLRPEPRPRRERRARCDDLVPSAEHAPEPEHRSGRGHAHLLVVPRPAARGQHARLLEHGDESDVHARRRGALRPEARGPRRHRPHGALGRGYGHARRRELPAGGVRRRRSNRLPQRRGRDPGDGERSGPGPAQLPGT